MSIQLIQQYYARVEKLIQYTGSHNESTLRKPFQDLLEQYAHSKNRFADYKQHVIDLLCRVCTVSVETVKIIKEMPQE